MQGPASADVDRHRALNPGGQFWRSKQVWAIICNQVIFSNSNSNRYPSKGTSFNCIGTILTALHSGSLLDAPLHS
jgi:hypothetical protein